MKITRNNRIKKEELVVDETIFSIANGYLGIRGNFTEGYGTDYDFPQTYLNGFYNFYDYTYEENLSGFPQQGQKFTNLFDGTRIDFIIDNEPLNLTTAELTSLERNYDLDQGITKRTAVYKKGNDIFKIEETKLVSTKYKYVISIDVTLSSDTYQGDILVQSYLRESLKTSTLNDPRLHSGTSSDLEILEVLPEDMSIHLKTTRSNLHLYSTMVHSEEMFYEPLNRGLVASKKVHLDSRNPFHLTKHTIHASDLYEETYMDVQRKLKTVFSNSFHELIGTEVQSNTLFWDDSYIKVDNNPKYELLLNYAMYQLNRQGGENKVHNIAAKGLSGEGYEGHYFWDTEIYMLPFFIYTNPEKAKRLLLNRYHTLEQSKQEARNLGYKNGAKIPWRTINGDETSPYYPAGSAQFHINSDIAYSVIKYVQATNDLEFLYDYGFELLIETARFLREAVNEFEDFYHLNSVTGPDEYTTVVDDNCYTNMMLKYHFFELVYFYKEYTKGLEKTCQRLKVTEGEIEHFEEIAYKMFVPFDEDKKIFLQDKNFLYKKKLDLSTLKYPLLLHYHPLFLYKHQVLKQADTVLALALLDVDNPEVIEKTYDFYEPITTHDSSLSKCVHSIVAYQLGRTEQADEYFRSVLVTDYDNTHENTEHGLHVANLGGSYLGFLYGVLGARLNRDYISLSPITSDEFKTYQTQFYYQGAKIKIKVDQDIYIETTKKVTVKMYDEIVEINGDYRFEFSKK